MKANWDTAHPRQKAGDWAVHALCRGVVGLHYPRVDDDESRRGGENGRSERVERAKAMCRVCPVSRECLQLAVQNGERHGVWGGYSFPMPTRIRLRLEREGVIGGGKTHAER